MTFPITIGSWIFPLVFMIGAYARAYFIMKAQTNSGGFGFGEALVGLFVMMGATITSLIAWLIWAVLR